MKQLLIIGAGGVTSHLLPCLIKAFKVERILIMDKDKLEKRNLDRQLFRDSDIGKFKVNALKDIHASAEIVAIPQWFTGLVDVPPETEAIVCCADNHEARRNAISAAYALGIKCYIGGNEYFDAEAYVTWDEHAGTKKDPRVRYPEIATSTEGSVLSCQGEEQVAHPQLAIANFRCAGLLLHLIYAHEIYCAEMSFNEKSSVAPYLPIEISSTLHETIIKTEKDLT